MTPTINDLYIKEGSYTKAQIMKRLGLRGAVGEKMFQQLRTKGIIKLVKQEASEADLNEVASEIDDGLEEISGGGSSYFFAFVGIILISGKPGGRQTVYSPMIHYFPNMRNLLFLKIF